MKNKRSKEEIRQLANELLNYWEKYNNEEYLTFVKSYKDRENLLNFVCKEMKHSNANTIYDVLNNNVKDYNTEDSANKKDKGLKLMKKISDFLSKI